MKISYFVSHCKILKALIAYADLMFVQIESESESESHSGKHPLIAIQREFLNVMTNLAQYLENEKENHNV